MLEKDYKYARIAFEAYSDSPAIQSFAKHGFTLPRWEDVSETHKEAWYDAAQAVRSAELTEMLAYLESCRRVLPDPELTEVHAE